MSYQIPPNSNGKYTSASSVFSSEGERELFKTLRKEIIDLRNTVDALVTLLNSQSGVQLFSVAPDAKDADVVHAEYDPATADGQVLPGPFTNPDVPRNLRVTGGSDLDGGPLTIVGTDQFDAPQSEEFALVAEDVTVGTKIFKTVTGAVLTQLSVEPSTVSIGTGDKIGVQGDVVTAAGTLNVDGTIEAVTIDVDEDAFTPTTAPNGTKVFNLAVPINPTLTGPREVVLGE